ncbi:MAG: hypothetical protein HKN72_12730 [Gemmatimonadetes bacterium]|nr:hypothetical protein [Gemmatimonadota bacterium]NNF14088.1 hypothetical protein [Gemmatimonadota bacterium]NNL31095.1 hypothetical protein [Gemmatimonadota bacterium]
MKIRSRHAVVARRAFPMLGAVCVSALVMGCDTDDPLPGFLGPEVPDIVGDAVAFGIWSPSGTDTCAASVHDQYFTVGPDGIRYPTWHPPVDPSTGCTFGHEHGRDPSGSDLFELVGAIPFGYANQHLEAGGFEAPRHEDHVGHKVEWQNDMVMNVGGTGSTVVSIECDVLTKMHQGTHSPDAFTNNMHEVSYHIRCSDGTGFSATLLTPIGTAGELVVGCDRDVHIPAGVANPPISPNGGGKRAVPEIRCLEERVINPEDDRPRFDSALRESWEISARLRTESGHTLVSFNPYFQVMDPSRYYDSSAERSLARPLDLCYRPELAEADRCEALAGDSVAWDDPRSPFKGVRRFVDVNANRVRNEEGPEFWYTDALGHNGRTEPFPGSIRQWVAQRDNSSLDLHGRVMGRDRDYDGPGVRAPN